MPPLLKVGGVCAARWRATEDFRRARIVGERRVPGGRRQLYVHFDGTDKRLDQWVDAGEVRPAAKHNGAEGVPSRQRATSAADVVDGDALEQQHQQRTRIRNVQSIQFGQYDVQTWYYSPFPEEYGTASHLYICEYCLKYMKLASSLLSHTCRLRHPPGTEIYRDGTAGLAVYEVDGWHQKLYCQNLCLLSKLFLDHKTVFFDVSPFLFYVLVEVDADGTHLAGYFSKEKRTLQEHNLACIMILPQHQRKGYGKFLVALSYELSKREGLVGGPEGPISDLGKLTYNSYWTWNILKELEANPSLSIDEISKRTAFRREDIISTLTVLDMVRFDKSHGDHVLNRQKVTPKRIASQLAPISPSWGNNLFNAKLLTWRSRKRPRKA
ncbi:Histone acetyltransferase [Plasmodiophora brassicae]